MRLVMINSTPARIFGGVEQWMVRASAGLTGRGHVVHAIGRPDSRFVERMQEVRVPAHTSRSGVDYGPLSALRIASVARRSSIELAIVNYNKELTQVALARSISPIRKVVIRSVLPMMDTGRRHRKLYSRHLDGMITPSREVKRTVEGYPWMDGVKIQNIPNGLDIGRVERAFDRLGGQSSVRQELGLSPNAFVIGALGRLEKHKGFQHLISAFAILAGKSKSAVLILAGEGSFVSALKEQASSLGDIAPRILFLGHHADVDRILMALDVLVLPSTTSYETFGQSLIEAMAFYIPVVGSNVGGIPEIIKNEENGLLVPPGDETALAKAIWLLERSAELRHRLGRAGRATVESHYLEVSMLDRLESYLEELLRTP
jgi:glycosyltransferase involved in cell wall biosynthesis